MKCFLLLNFYLRFSYITERFIEVYGGWKYIKKIFVSPSNKCDFHFLFMCMFSNAFDIS